jgi:hypothetical protein
MRQSASRSKERRKDPRYRVQVPVVFRWGSDNVHADGGFSRDVSLKALFVMARDAPPLKTRVRCRILMPASFGAGGNPISVVGLVTRLSTSAEEPGFVIKAKLYAPDVQ